MKFFRSSGIFLCDFYGFRITERFFYQTLLLYLRRLEKPDEKERTDRNLSFFWRDRVEERYK